MKFVFHFQLFYMFSAAQTIRMFFFATEKRFELPVAALVSGAPLTSIQSSAKSPHSCTSHTHWKWKYWSIKCQQLV